LPFGTTKKPVEKGHLSQGLPERDSKKFVRISIFFNKSKLFTAFDKWQGSTTTKKPKGKAYT